MFFFGTLIQYNHKTDLSVAIVCMVNHTALENNKTFYKNYSGCFFNKKNENPDKVALLLNVNNVSIFIGFYFPRMALLVGPKEHKKL
jgi:hypothetical protein